MKKTFKDTKKNKSSKISFRYNQEAILRFLKTNIATSILIGLVILFIVAGNPFVVGALIGGYLGAKRTENLHKTFSTTPLILGASIGAILGGITLIFSVAIGSFFHTIGGILGVLSGAGAIIAFSGDLTEKITYKLMSLSVMKIGKKITKIKKKKSNPSKNRSVSKIKTRIKTT